MIENASAPSQRGDLGRRAVGPISRPSARRRLSRHAAPAVLLAPAGIVLVFVLGYPLVRLVINSFQDYSLQSLFLGKTSWIGITNYVAVFTDPEFAPVLVRTGVFTGSVVVACVAIGMAVAQLLTRINIVMRTTVGIVLVIAWAIPTVASTLVWQWLFQPIYGVVNWIVSQLGIFGSFTTHNWLSTGSQAFFVIALLIVWQSVPFIALTLYASQSQIAAEYYEAAMLDGASGWRIYRSITLPFLRPVLNLVTILSVIWHFNTFNQIWILTQGGPSNATTTLGIWSFQTAFAANSFGRGSAIAVVTAILLMALTSVYIRRLVRSGDLQ